MTTYEAKKNQSGDLILTIDGVQSICPYVNPIPVQGNMGQVQIMRMPCTSACPHVQVENSDTRTTWSISCGHETKSFHVNFEQEQPKLKSDILHLT